MPGCCNLSQYVTGEPGDAPIGFKNAYCYRVLLRLDQNSASQMFFFIHETIFREEEMKAMIDDCLAEVKRLRVDARRQGRRGSRSDGRRQ